MKISLYLGIFLLAGVLFAQQKEVPDQARQDFETRYPYAADVSWEQNDEGFAASFNENGRETSVIYDGNGTLQETRREIDGDELPEAVNASVTERYNGYEINRAYQVDRDGQTSYRVDLYGTDGNKYAEFGEDGSFVEENDLRARENEKEMY